MLMDVNEKLLYWTPSIPFLQNYVFKTILVAKYFIYN